MGADTVLLTVTWPDGSADVEVSAETPIGEWLPGFVGHPVASGLLDGRQADLSSGLAAQGAQDGARLVIGGAGPEIARTRLGAAAPSIRVVVDGRCYTFPARPVVVGRGASCHVRCSPGVVSREHITINPTAAGWIADDLDTPNGTWVDGERQRRVAVGRKASLRLGHPTRGPMVVIEPLADLPPL